MTTMSTVDSETVVLARKQAAGLRALADMITANPALAKRLGYALRNMHQPLVSDDGDPRGALAAFHAAATASGAVVEVENRADRCRVWARFGPVAVLMTATADLMAGEPSRAPKYAPLAVGVSAGA